MYPFWLQYSAHTLAARSHLRNMLGPGWSSILLHTLPAGKSWQRQTFQFLIRLSPLGKTATVVQTCSACKWKKMSVVKSMKSSLALCPVGCLTCRVPESPSARVCRHTQNRRRYSLSARSQGGAPEPRKKQSHGGSEDGQIHCRGGRPAITRGGGSSNDTKLGLMK